MPLPVPTAGHLSLGIPLIDSKHAFVPPELAQDGVVLGTKTIGDNRITVRLPERIENNIFGFLAKADREELSLAEYDSAGT